MGLDVGMFGLGSLTPPGARVRDSSDRDRGVSTRTTEDRMDERMENRMESRMGDRKENRMGNRMGDRMEDRMENRMEDRMGGRMEDQMGTEGLNEGRYRGENPAENRMENRMASSSPADADISAFGFPFEGREAAASSGRGAGNVEGAPSTPGWPAGFRGESDDEVLVEGGGELEREEEELGGEEAGLRGELEVFASHLRQEFELKVGALLFFQPYL